MRLRHFLVLLLSLATVAVQATDLMPVRIAAVENDEGTERYYEVVVREAYRRIGQPVELTYMPAARGLVAANTGKSDALLARLPVIEDTYTNMRRIPTSIGPMSFLAVSMKPSLEVRNWEDMRALSIGVRRGYKIAVDKTAGMNVSLVDSYENMFRMMAQGRVDVVVIREPGVAPTLRALKSAGVLNGTETFRSSVLEYLSAYHYINVERGNLIGPLDQALKAMTKDGFLEKAMREARGGN
ncbi:amino acid ABC transporter substrate-binding protein [Chitinimonas arctica]|uniref:Amino acid ABC transporter substrate-binding protein n=1 Tax=Chitinimonas arctica TaxID=2594795 RepID=A0A516SGX1_9NEIS|nr:transporter substrate-binding domain-containing protein [Chitinimonas arctica]QDQ27403.1 amino acid ABC transporter substrate-binding protein [Chitinimonas arctica]